MIQKIREKQELLNKMFEEEGLTDELLREQIELNKKIHEENITDEEYVQ